MSASTIKVVPPATCTSCARPMPSSLSACPACGHRPPDTEAASAVNSDAAPLPGAITVGPREETRARWVRRAGALGALALLAWKFKFVLLALLSKGKLLLFGLGKWTTFATMALSFGVYWTAFGWSFALGLVLSIYIHEMGHVAALRRLGIPASAPMFVPGVGAWVRLKQHPASAMEDARIGLAGPIWGASAALGAYAGHLAFGLPVLAAIARTGAWINLFNLLPVWQLDGARAFRALSRAQRTWAVAGVGLAWFVYQEPMLLLLAFASVARLFTDQGPERPDPVILLHYLALVVGLSALATSAGGAALPQ